jgi:transcriptional regulator with XRE-family HTH domain
MNVKQEIELLLEELKNAGIDRSTIEEDLGYSKNYITQSLSRKVSPRILIALRIYAHNIFYNTQDQQLSMVNADTDEYEAKAKWEIKTEALINAIFEEKDRAIKKAEEYAKKMEAQYQDVVKENLKLLDIISNLSKEKSGNVSTAEHKEEVQAAKKNSQKKNNGH